MPLCLPPSENFIEKKIFYLKHFDAKLNILLQLYGIKMCANFLLVLSSFMNYFSSVMDNKREDRAKSAQQLILFLKYKVNKSEHSYCPKVVC